MKYLPIILLFAALMMAGCGQKIYTQNQARSAAPATEAAKPEPILTAKDLKLETKSSPIKEYKDVSLGAVNQEKSAIQQSQQNSNAVHSGGTHFQNKPF